jgi:hypothetical protein
MSGQKRHIFSASRFEEIGKENGHSTEAIIYLILRSGSGLPVFIKTKIRTVGALKKPMINEPPKTLEEIQAERRRQRWGYFWTPFITLTSVVSSVAMLMFLVRSCQERNLPGFIVPPTSPLHRQGTVKTTPQKDGSRVAEPETPPAPNAARDSQIERKSPAP